MRETVCATPSRMRLSVLALLSFLSACNSNNPCSTVVLPPPSDGGGGGGDIFPGTGGGSAFGGGMDTGGGNANFPVVLVGQPATVTTSTAITLDSCDLLITPTAATSTVVGPDNLPVASTEGGLSDNNGLAYTENVTFTPQQPGDFHIVTTFDPNLGVAQTDVFAAFDRTTLAAQDTYDVSLMQECLEYLVTDHGTLLCTGGDNMIHAFRGGAALDSHDGFTMAVHASSIWIAASSTQSVSHFIDTGASTLFADDSGVVDTDAPVTALVPGDDDVLVVTDNHATLYTSTDAGFSSTFTWTGASGLIGAARTGSSLIACASDRLFGNDDGGTALDIIAGTQNLTCVAFGPEGLWTTDNTTGALGVFTPGTHSASATLSGLVAWSSASLYGVATTTAGSIADVPKTFSATWDPDAGPPVISVWGDQGSGFWVMNGWVVTRDGSGQVVVKRVPSP